MMFYMVWKHGLPSVAPLSLSPPPHQRSPDTPLSTLARYLVWVCFVFCLIVRLFVCPFVCLFVCLFWCLFVYTTEISSAYILGSSPSLPLAHCPPTQAPNTAWNPRDR